MTTPEPRPVVSLPVARPPREDVPTHVAQHDDDCCAAPAAVEPAAAGADPAGTDPAGADAGWLRAARRARALSWFSLAWMTGEGALGLAAGVAAGSISLLGWALGSIIEGLASIIVIWRFTGSRTLSEGAERHAQRAVALSFFLLAPYLVVESLRDLVGGHDVTSSVLGLVVTAASLVVMPLLGRAKQRLGARLGSEATSGEGLQNLMCAAQAAAVLVGLAASATLGWSWLDPAVGLLLAGWAVNEGVEAWRGDGCC